MKAMHVLFLLGLLLAPASLVPTPGPTTPPTPISDNSASSQCISSEQCSSGLSCVNNLCTDPCGGLCAVNAECVTDDQGTACSCLPGYSGNPFTECTQEETLQCTSDSQCSSSEACLNFKCIDPCHQACGLNADCKVANRKPICACIRGFYRNVTFGCQPIATTQCKTNNHCAVDKACVLERCLDPCVGLCGNNTQCKVRNHYPSCACEPGYTGDPFIQCDPLCLPLSPDTSKSKKKYFIVVKEKLTADTASTYCQTRGLQLASIESEEENNLVKSFLSNGEYHHTSGRLLRDPWIFYWMNTGNVITYSNWRPGNPSGSRENMFNCIAVSSSGWNNFNCEGNRSFICQHYE